MKIKPYKYRTTFIRNTNTLTFYIQRYKIKKKRCELYERDIKNRQMNLRSNMTQAVGTIMRNSAV